MFAILVCNKSFFVPMLTVLSTHCRNVRTYVYQAKLKGFDPCRTGHIIIIRDEILLGGTLC